MPDTTRTTATRSLAEALFASATIEILASLLADKGIMHEDDVEDLCQRIRARIEADAAGEIGVEHVPDLMRARLSVMAARLGTTLRTN